tara:strand:- start:340 stop:717 length:378 start_codon:yes stop_codon:yes gene_type:complete
LACSKAVSGGTFVIFAAGTEGREGTFVAVQLNNIFHRVFRSVWHGVFDCFRFGGVLDNLIGRILNQIDAYVRRNIRLSEILCGRIFLRHKVDACTISRINNSAFGVSATDSKRRHCENDANLNYV